MSRSRGNGEGSIYQRKSDGKWCTAITLDNGKRKVLYGKTRQEVARKLNLAFRAREQGLPVAPDRQTLGQYLATWLEECVKPRRRPRTYESYSDLVRLHIGPALGRTRLAALTAPQIQSFLNQKLASGLSPATVKYLHAVLHVALNQAVKWELIPRNPAKAVEPPQRERHEVQVLDLDEFKALLAAIRGHRLEALYTVALALGIRQGEALGLRWQDVDLTEGKVHVRKQVQRKDGKLELVDLKTPRSRRTIDLPTFAMVALRGHKGRIALEREAAGTDWVEWNLVFPSTRGTPLDAKNVTHRFQAFLRKAGFRHMRFHDLRHACASLLLAQGESPRTIMDILGHSQFSTTMDIYSHVMPSIRREAARRMDSLLAAGD